MELNIYKITKEDAIGVINERHAFEQLKPDEVFIFGGTLSSQTRDSHESRMTATSIRNYAEDAKSGFPLIVMHDKKPYPIGKVFGAEISGEATTRSLNNGQGLTLDILAYIPRNLQVAEGLNTDNYIRGIGTGTFGQMSIGFNCDENKDLICSICSNPILECQHRPGKKYNGERAFFWVDNAHAREASLVSVGSNPDAKIVKTIRNREIKLETEVLMERLVQINPDFKNRLEGITDESDESMNRVLDILADTQKTITELKERISKAAEKEKMADEFLKIFVDEAVKERVRAVGANPKFNEEKYREMLMKNGDITYIRSEAELYREQAEDALSGERAGKLAEEKLEKEKPKRKINSNSSYQA